MTENDVERSRIAVFAGPNATILNSEPLVTSNKGRARRGLDPRRGPGGPALRFDALRPQRLAAPVTVYVEQFSAHPLERDSAELYAPPDGYVDREGIFRQERRSADEVPVYEIELRPEDGLYPLPYMAFQADGRPWEGDEADPFGPPHRSRQPFYPDPARVFEEIDRLQPGDDGLASHLSRLADFDFYRAAPPGGYTKGLPKADRTDVGDDDIGPEAGGKHFFPYRPPHLLRQPSRRTLARLTNIVQRALASGAYQGGLWLEGSPHLEETAWWLNLLIDTPWPIAGSAAQRDHGAVGSEADRNIIDAVRYLCSRIWADEDGRDALGVVAIVDQCIMAARSVQKRDARPGGYGVTGGHGGVLGTISSTGRPVLSMRPVQRHTWSSDLRVTVLPEVVRGVRRIGRRIEEVTVTVRGTDGELDEDAVPFVSLVKHGQYTEDEHDAADPDVGVLARLDDNLERQPLSGFVAEGSAPFGTLSASLEAALKGAVFSGMPVVKVGRGNADGLTERTYAPFAIAGGNLSATKARLLLMAAMLRLGALPAARDPMRPTAAETTSTRAALDRYQDLFDRH